MILEENKKNTKDQYDYSEMIMSNNHDFVVSDYKESDYSKSKIRMNFNVKNAPEYSSRIKTSNPTPENLKRAMFKTSSRGIAAALNNK